ncbi:MAG: hypothetical protein KDK53_19445 [Maritimibacter sp.]|nr:hypothetical protein [Maritimibacter sp.]
MRKALFAATTLAGLGLSTATACPGEGVYRSIDSTLPTSITFVNAVANDEEYFSVYWLDYNGERQHYADIFPGRNVRLDTYVTHPWLVTMPEPGGGELCYHIYLPDRSPATVTLD